MKDQTSQPLYLGIDGGGSTCRARLTDADGRVLGGASSGPANLRLGIDVVRESILHCTNEALRRAGASSDLSQLNVGMGLAGALLEHDRDSTAELRGLFAHCTLLTDAQIACLGAHHGDFGAIIIVGTGSCAQVRDAAGWHSYGGWGLAISDHASGAWLGRAAVAHALQALEQLRPASQLTDAINAHFQHRPAAALAWSLDATPADYAAFAPLIFEHAADADPVATALITAGCAELERLIEAVAQHRTDRIALLGGLAAPYTPYLSAPSRARLCAARGDALDGALLLAGLPTAALTPTTDASDQP